MSVENEKGSYNFTSFKEGSVELERLKVQALQCWDRERDLLLRGGLKEGMHVLDPGCGPGFVSAAIAGLVGDGTVTGLEPDAGLAAVAHLTAQEEPRFRVKEGSVYSIPFADATFDLVYARFLFQHLENPAQALLELKRVVKPGGRLQVLDVDDALLIVEPEPEGLSEFIRKAREAQAAHGGDRYVGRKLPALLREAGLEPVVFEVPCITSQELGLQAFLKIISGYKLYISDSDESARLLEKVFQEAPLLQSIGTVGVFFASGQKSVT